MLLDTLIDIEINNFKHTRDMKHIRNIELFVDILKESIITERFLLGLELREDEARSIISELKIQDKIQEKIHLTCSEYGEDSTITLNTKLCPVCDRTISEDNHELEPVYETHLQQHEYRAFKKNISDKMLNIFLDQDYSGNYRNLVENISNLVPLVGAGFSVPIGAPSWENLFLKFRDSISEQYHSAYEAIVKTGNYFEGISLIYTLSKSIKTVEQIKVMAAQIIENKIDYNIHSGSHNYTDLLKVKFPYYLTTNYDNALNNYSNKFSVPLEIEDIEDVQHFVANNKFRVIHLHGIIDKPNSLVLTSEDYEKKYSNEKFTKKLLALMVHKSILFLGFSFSDVYFEELYKYIQDNVGGRHFIVTTNAKKADTLIRMNIIPIVLKVNKNEEMVLALRYLLKNLEVNNHEQFN